MFLTLIINKGSNWRISLSGESIGMGAEALCSLPRLSARPLTKRAPMSPSFIVES
jgi:hypothetical protein